jgi:hypothetical protein
MCLKVSVSVSVIVVVVVVDFFFDRIMTDVAVRIATSTA